MPEGFDFFWGGGFLFTPTQKRAFELTFEKLVFDNSRILVVKMSGKLHVVWECLLQKIFVLTVKMLKNHIIPSMWGGSWSSSWHLEANITALPRIRVRESLPKS